MDWIGKSKFYFVESLDHRGQTKEIFKSKNLPVTALKNETRRKEYFSYACIRNDSNKSCGPRAWNKWQKAKLSKQTNDFLREKSDLEIMESPP